MDRGFDFDLQLFAEEGPPAGNPLPGAAVQNPAPATDGQVPNAPGKAGVRPPATDGPSPASAARPFEDEQVSNAPAAAGSQPPADGQTPNAPPAKDGQAEKVELNLAQAFADARAAYDPGQAGEIAAVLKEAGVKENATANKLAAWVLTQQQRVQEALLEETLKEFGGTKENPGEKLKEARLKAGRAMDALEKKVPGLRDSLRQSVLDADVRVLKALAAVGELVGEDGNFMGGAGNAGAPSVASLYFPKTS